MKSYDEINHRTKSVDEIKEELLKYYPKYFEALDVEFQARCLMYLPNTDYKEQLDKNLRNLIDCERTIAESKGLRDYEYNKQKYQRDLKVYNEIMGFNK